MKITFWDVDGSLNRLHLLISYAWYLSCIENKKVGIIDMDIENAYLIEFSKDIDPKTLNEKLSSDDFSIRSAWTIMLWSSSAEKGDVINTNIGCKDNYTRAILSPLDIDAIVHFYYNVYNSIRKIHILISNFNNMSSTFKKKYNLDVVLLNLPKGMNIFSAQSMGIGDANIFVSVTYQPISIYKTMDALAQMVEHMKKYGEYREFNKNKHILVAYCKPSIDCPNIQEYEKEIKDMFSNPESKMSRYSASGVENMPRIDDVIILPEIMPLIPIRLEDGVGEIVLPDIKHLVPVLNEILDIRRDSLLQLLESSDPYKRKDILNSFNPGERQYVELILGLKRVHSSIYKS